MWRRPAFGAAEGADGAGAVAPVARSSLRIWSALRQHIGTHPVAAVIAGFTLLRLLFAANAPLLPQEAYYWTWSLHPDWSYFDHPPLATYSIWLTTTLLGSSVVTIKLAAVLWSFGWNVLWALLVRDMFGADRRLACATLIALNLTLIYQGFGVMPTPDAPLIFAWVGAIWAVWRATQGGSTRWWFVAGAFVGLSFLAKYSGVLLLPVVLLYLLWSPAQRHWLARPQPYLALVLAAVMFTPVLIWNAQHDWVSLAFQSTRRVDAMGGFKPRYFLMLVATQCLLLTPWVFAIAMAALGRGIGAGFRRAPLDDRVRLLLLSGAVPILLFTPISLRSIVKINWLAPAWWSLVILGVHALLARTDGMARLRRGLASSAAILAAAAALAAIPNLPVVGNLNSWSGWDKAAARVAALERAEQAAGHPTFIFSPNYKISSLIRLYLPGHPRTYAQDIYGAPALQFDYFPLDRDLKGATGLLVLSDQDQSELDLDRLKTYFDKIERIDTIETHGMGKLTRRIDIYRCTGYVGHPARPPARNPLR